MCREICAAVLPKQNLAKLLKIGIKLRKDWQSQNEGDAGSVSVKLTLWGYPPVRGHALQKNLRSARTIT